MAAYMIFIRESEIRDPEAMVAYSGSNRDGTAAFKERFAIEPLAVYGACEAIEGKAAEGVVLLKFPDMEKARGWYNSPEYQKAIPLRMQAADYRAILFEGL